MLGGDRRARVVYLVAEQPDFLQQQLAHVHVPDLQQSPLEQHFLSEDAREGSVRDRLRTSRGVAHDAR